LRDFGKYQKPNKTVKREGHEAEEAEKVRRRKGRSSAESEEGEDAWMDCYGGTCGVCRHGRNTNGTRRPTESKAIAAYEETTGLTVKFVLPTGTLAGFNSKGVVGLFRDDEALRRILDGTGLNYRSEDATTKVVGVQATSTVSVTSSVPTALSMERFTEPLIETPQSISIIPQFVIKDQGLSTLRDALRNVPGISLAAGESGAQGDNLTIRGFTARNDIFLDGIRDFGSYYRDAFNYEQVEALEGPAGIQFGRGSTGGVINQESKVPQADQHIVAQTQFGTDLTRRLTVDLNSPEDASLGGTAFRTRRVGLRGAMLPRFGGSALLLRSQSG
jgi:catecholate siderophore receptor